MLEVLIASVTERDIDLLLLEEFVSSPLFVRWFLRAAGIDGGTSGKVIRAQRAATMSNGESDLEITLAAGTGASNWRVLIEDKVATGLQPMQAQRYRERGSSYVEQGICKHCVTVLVAPERYFGTLMQTRGFDSAVTYEAIRGWFERDGDCGDRALYKRRLLSAAIEKATRGWQLVEDEPITRFWQKYWELASDVAPELEMPKPLPKPAGSSFIRFHPAGLPVGVTLMHKVAYGNVDLQFAGRGAAIAKLRAKYGAHLRRGMHIERAGKSAVIRIKVPPMNLTDDLEANRDIMLVGIRTARSLYRWLLGLKTPRRRSRKQPN